MTYLQRVRRYGLLASVLAGHRDDFDHFLSFYNHYENNQGLMCWQQVLTEIASDSMVLRFELH